MAAQNEHELRPMLEAEALYLRWLAYLDDLFKQHTTPELRSEIVRDELHLIYLGRPHGARLHSMLNSEMGISVLADSFDPRNATLEAEYRDDVDLEQYAPRKPLIWFWRLFDRSPLGENVWLGLRFRRMLGQYIFRQVGKDVEIHADVTFTFGYNLTVEDGCVIGRGAVLDDTGGGLTVKAGAKVEPGARVSA